MISYPIRRGWVSLFGEGFGIAEQVAGWGAGKDDAFHGI